MKLSTLTANSKLIACSYFFFGSEKTVANSASSCWPLKFKFEQLAMFNGQQKTAGMTKKSRNHTQCALTFHLNPYRKLQSFTKRIFLGTKNKFNISRESSGLTWRYGTIT